MAKNYDVIVIGAGNGGLVAAATACKLGKKTLLIERHNLPGGAASSFVRGRFEFETALHELAAYGPKEHPQGIRQMFDWLGVDIPMHEIPGAYRYIITGKDGFDVALPNGRDAVIDKIEEVVPGSRTGVSKLFDYGEECIRGYELLQDGKSMQEVAKEAPAFVKYATTPYDQVLSKLGIQLKARQMLVTYVENGAYAPSNRSHEITTALVKSIQDHGGDVWFNTEVKRILTQNGRATGVQVGDKQIYSRAVISDILPDTVYSKMINPAVIPEKALKLTNARQLGTSGYLVYLGLNKSPEELGIKDYSVFISSTGDSRTQYERMNTINDNDFMVMNCLNIAAPETFARYMRTPNGDIYGYYGQQWDQTLTRMANLNEEAQPVPGLFFCGGSSFMMDGYSSAYFSGFTISKLACTALDKEGVNNE